MDTTQEFQELKKKSERKEPVTLRDVAVAIANDDNSLASYLIVNDFKQVYKLLNQSASHLVIGDNAGFIPNADRAAAELHTLIQTKDWPTLNYILSHFKINLDANNWTSHVDLLEKLSDIGAIGKDREGKDIFKLQFA